MHALVAAGHKVAVQTQAGAAIGFSDADYQAAGALIVADAAAVYACPLVVKVKEPLPAEIALLQAGQILFCYFHLAAAPMLTQGLLERQIIAIAYETVSDASGGLPLLTPMSEVAGRSYAGLLGGRDLSVPASAGRTHHANTQA